MPYRHLSICLLCLALFAPKSLLADPINTVETFHQALLASMQAGEQWSPLKRVEHLSQSVRTAFDLPLMAQLAAGPSYRKASPEDQADFVDAFSAMTIRTYADQFKSFSGQQFRTVSKADGPRKTQLIATQIIDGSDAHDLTYVVRQDRTKTWRIIDVLLGSSGISQMAVRRSEYTSILKTGGLAALTTALQKN